VTVFFTVSVCDHLCCE